MCDLTHKFNKKVILVLIYIQFLYLTLLQKRSEIVENKFYDFDAPIKLNRKFGL